MTKGLIDTLCRCSNFPTDSRNSAVKNVIDEEYLEYSHYFQFTVEDYTDILCPLFCINNIINALSGVDYTEPTNIVVPLSVAPVSDGYKTIDTALARNLLENYSLLKKICIKDECFYVKSSLILDEDFTILYMPCIRYNAVDNTIKESSIVTLVDLSVLNQVSGISKALIKKILPYYADNYYEFYIDSLDTPVVAYSSILFKRMDKIISCSSIEDCDSQELLINSIPTIINSIENAY